MKVNQNGFSLSYTLLGLVAVAILSFAGWRVYENQKLADNSIDNSSIANEVVKQEKKEELIEEKLSGNWLLRESDKASIRVPDGFEILANQESDFNFWLPDVPQGTLKYQKGTLAKIVDETPKHFELGLIVTYNGQGWNERGIETNQLKTYSGLDVKVRQFEQTDEPNGLDFAKGTKLIQYKVITDDSYLSIDYAYLGEGVVDVIEEMVKTATIK